MLYEFRLLLKLEDTKPQKGELIKLKVSSDLRYAGTGDRGGVGGGEGRLRLLAHIMKVNCSGCQMHDMPLTNISCILFSLLESPQSVSLVHFMMDVIIIFVLGGKLRMV